MNTPLFISSSEGHGPSHDFTIKYTPQITLEKNKTYSIRLNSLSMYYSWFNVSNKHNNNKIKFTTDKGTTWHKISFQDGNYSYNDLNKQIQSQLEQGGISKTGISLNFEITLLRVVLTLEPSFQVEFNSRFNELIGFRRDHVYTHSQTGESEPNITNSVDSLQIRCSLLSNSSVSGKYGDVLYQFSTSNLHPSYPFEKTSNVVGSLYSPINTRLISTIRIYITDQNGNPVDLNDQEVSLVLILKED